MTVGLQLLLLTHPDMPINDAIFQTHRFQDVLGGHYLFASLAPGNYRFPYPIGLYLFARPFAAFAPTTADRMMLLRVIVVAVDACAAALLYRLVMRWRGDELEAVSSVVAYHLLPLGFGVIVTGQPDECVRAVAGDDHARRRRARRGRSGGRLGGDRGRRRARGRGVPVAHEHVRGARHAARRRRAARSRSRASARGARPARLLVVAAIGALIVSIGVYYAYFMDVYREAFGRIASETGHATAAAGGRTPLTRLVELPGGLALTFGVPRDAARDRRRRSQLAARPRHRRPCSGSSRCGSRSAGSSWSSASSPRSICDTCSRLCPSIGILIAIGFAAGWRTRPDRPRARVAAAGWMVWVCAVSWTGALGH